MEIIYFLVFIFALKCALKVMLHPIRTVKAFEAAKRIPADQRQAVLERMEQYNSHEAGGMEVFKAEIEARRVLDSALKEQTQDREHEKTKVKGRGRTD